MIAVERRTVILASIAALTVIICVYLLGQNTRFATQNAGDGYIYKIDRRTGRTVLLAGDTEVPVSSPSKPKPESKNDKAIRLGKEAETLSGSAESNDSVIRKWISGLKGPLRIVGWRARQIDDQAWLVTYAYEDAVGPHTMAFEVNLQAELVRKVKGDSALARKYRNFR